MVKYKITFKKSVVKDLRGIPNQQIVKILNRIDKLAENPRGKGALNFLDKSGIVLGKEYIAYSMKLLTQD